MVDVVIGAFCLVIGVLMLIGFFLGMSAPQWLFWLSIAITIGGLVYFVNGVVKLAKAPAPNQDTSPAEAGSSQLNVQHRLAQLKELHSKGLITKEEYEARRQRVLDEV